MPIRKQAIETLERFPHRLAEQIEGLSAEQLTTVAVPGEWTIAQNVHHLVDSHMNSYIRMKLIYTEDHPTLKPYDQNIWAELADANDANVDDSLMMLRGLHRRWVRFLRNLDEDDWSRTAQHPEIGDITLHEMVVGYANHCEAHTAQIQAVLDAMLLAEPEAI